MLLKIPDLLDQGQVRAMRTRLEAPDAPWVDGRATAGQQAAAVKNNVQIAQPSPLSRELGAIVLAALDDNPLFFSAALPKRVYPPMFNRYQSSMRYGRHVDGAIRKLPRDGMKMRADLSATLFLSATDEYDGGELLIEDTYGLHTVKSGAGDLVVYPASSVHRVAPVTRGARLACVFWVHSLVRDASRRAILHELDRSIQRLNHLGADEPTMVDLAGVYQNLLRQWIEA